MALYDGFFDATFDEETQEYDREYGPADFTSYFANIIGSGVCVHENPDSFKAEYEDGTLYLRPGYLFIRGFWLANKPDEGETDYKGYAVTIPAGMTGSMAVVAHLNLGQRMIEIEVRPVSQAYPDALVLAIVTANTAEDTRHNTDICGVIETAGDLSRKVEWALNYINTEIESKLAQVEADIAAQDAKLTAKIAEVQAVADSIVPPPVGSIKFSASQNAGAEWLRCDGSFVNEEDYPELVEALGKLTPSGDKFQLISSGEIGPQISNGVLYEGRMWVYSYSEKKLYGVDLNGTAEIKEIAVTSEERSFKEMSAPTVTNPLALSIVPHKTDSGTTLFLAQLITAKYPLILSAPFSGTEQSISLAAAYSSVSGTVYVDAKSCVPYVTSIAQYGSDQFYCAIGGGIESGVQGSYLVWSGDEATCKVAYSQPRYSYDGKVYKGQRISFNKKTNYELVLVNKYVAESGTTATQLGVVSLPHGTFNRSTIKASSVEGASGIPNSLNFVSNKEVVFNFSDSNIQKMSLTDVSPNEEVNTEISLPSAAKTFVDGAAYLWGKDIYMIFVGTGIIFSRTLEEGSFGYLDTTSVLGTITQFGYLDYSQDEGTLYLLGQDTANTVKAAKIVLNTLFDYANDGAWLPMIASDGVPAYIKAYGDNDSTVQVQITVANSITTYVDAAFNGESLFVGTFSRNVNENGTVTIGAKVNNIRYSAPDYATIKINGTTIGTLSFNANDGAKVGDELTRKFKVSDLAARPITIDIS